MALPGNYALIPNESFPAIAGVTLSGEKGLLENTYNITGSFESVTLVMKYGPQGRLYDSDLNAAGEARATLESFGGIGFSLGGVQFGSNKVAVWVGDQRFVYTKDQLDTEFIANFLQRWPDDIETAQIAADVIKAGMKIFSLAEEKVTAWGPKFPQPDEFMAKFVEVNGFDVTSPSSDGESTAVISGGDVIILYTEVTTVNDVQIITKRLETYTRETTTPPASDIQGDYEADPGAGFIGLLSDSYGYGLPQVVEATAYEFNFDAAQVVQTGFDESFNFGPSTIDDGIVTGSDLADVIDGTYTDLDGTSVSDGDDIVHAGSGDDVITGGSGNDLLDGGAGTDTVMLDGARDEFVFSFDTNLTVQDTAPSSGVNEGTDTLIDIERVNFSDGSHAEINTNAQGIVITYFNAGETQASARTVLDSANAYSWSSYTQTFAANGVTLIDRVTHYDDGRVLDVDYAGGVRTSQTVTDVEDAFVWADYTQTFGADGVTLIDRVTNYDDGRVLDVDYAGGVRTSQTVTDVADAFVWADYTQTFGADGVTLIDRVTHYDDGRVLDVDYVGGVRTSQTMTDVADAFVWSDFTQTFGADGITVIDRVTHYDDGRVLDVDYAGGVRTSQTMTDVADVYSWASYTQIFDISGNLISTTYLDDVA